MNNYGILKTYKDIQIGFDLNIIQPSYDNYIGDQKTINLSKIEAIDELKKINDYNKLLILLSAAFKNAISNNINLNYPIFDDAKVAKVYMVIYDDKFIVTEIIDYNKFLMLE